MCHGIPKRQGTRCLAKVHPCPVPTGRGAIRRAICRGPRPAWGHRVPALNDPWHLSVVEVLLDEPLVTREHHQLARGQRAVGLAVVIRCAQQDVGCAQWGEGHTYTMDFSATNVHCVAVTPNDIKAVAVELLEGLKAEKLRVHRWRDKESTRDAVRIAIRDFLWSDQTGLPECYTEDDVQTRSDEVFRHVFRAYATVPSPYYEDAAA